MKHYEFWFVVGSQTLYGEDVLTTVANRARRKWRRSSPPCCRIRSSIK